MTTKTIGSTLSAPCTPSAWSCSPNADAVAPATMPRGAIHASSVRSRQVKLDRIVASTTVSGPQHQHQHGDQHQRPGQHVADVGRADGRGDQDEEHADQQLDERLLELAGEGDVHAPLVAEHDPQDAWRR